MVISSTKQQDARCQQAGPTWSAITKWLACYGPEVPRSKWDTTPRVVENNQAEILMDLPDTDR